VFESSQSSLIRDIACKLPELRNFGDAPGLVGVAPPPPSLSQL